MVSRGGDFFPADGSAVTGHDQVVVNLSDPNN